MLRNTRMLLLGSASIFMFSSAGATTCSCANVPLLGSLEPATPEPGKWLLSSTFEYHDISDLVSGSSSINDATGRDRTAKAMIVEVSKSLPGKVSISLLLSAIQHDREIGSAHDSASGLGDAIVMARYSPKSISLYSRNALSFGIGSRLPIGESDASSGGIVYAEDLQPSTGAFAVIGWAYAARSLNDSSSARLYSTLSYTYNYDNDRNYRFGHELAGSIGMSYQTQTPWGFSMDVVYRQGRRDERSDVSIPNTGGDWVDVVPAIQYHINENMAFRASAKLPVYRDLNDQLQFTTKHAARLTFSYTFGR